MASDLIGSDADESAGGEGVAGGRSENNVVGDIGENAVSEDIEVTVGNCYA